MKNSILKTVALSLVIAFSSCNEDDTMLDSNEKSNTKVAITDAPIDNAEVSGAFVTITDVKIDGQSINGFSKTTIDLLALQNGKKEILGDLDLNVGTVNQVTLVLDYENDEDGNSPGSFIETKNGIKHQLRAASNEIVIFDRANILANTNNEIVIDFDLRKTIVASNDLVDKFDFVTNAELSSGLRFVNSAEAGVVSGNVNGMNSSSEKIIVFAYEAGTYTEAEANEQGASGVTFANATTSAVVSSTGNYKLNFLKEGNYEIQFASFEDSNNDGELEFKGMLDVESTLGLDVNNINVSSFASVNLMVNIKGMR